MQHDAHLMTSHSPTLPRFVQVPRAIQTQVAVQALTMVETDEKVLSHGVDVDDPCATQVGSGQPRVAQLTMRYELASQR